MDRIIRKRLLNFIIDTFLVFVITLVATTCINIKHELAQPVLHLLYYFMMESVFGITIGKIITKTKVEYISNQNKFLSILIRTISRLIPFEPLSIFLSDEHTMWHDKLSKTKLVVKE